MLDTKEPATVTPTVLSGNVRVSLSFGSLDEAFAAQERYSNPIKLIGERLQTEKNYYIYIEPLTPQAEVSLVVQQSHTVQTLAEGIPHLVSYHDSQDSSKYLIYNLPGGDTSVVFYVRSKTPGFYPRLVYSLQFDSSNFTYPPDEFVPYEQCTDWDEDLYSLKTTADFKGLPQRAFLIINLVYHAVSRQKSSAAITAGQVSSVS